MTVRLTFCLSVCLMDKVTFYYTRKDHRPQHAQLLKQNVTENTIKKEKRGIRCVLIGCYKEFVFKLTVSQLTQMAKKD